MNIERFKQQHDNILSGISHLRSLTKAGISNNADDIAAGIASLGQLVTQHLAIEDRILYPMLQQSNNTQLADMGKKYQDEMTGIATPFITFTRQWRTATALRNEPEKFRDDANTVLKRLYERMCQENTEFYPVIEASAIGTSR